MGRLIFRAVTPWRGPTPAAMAGSRGALVIGNGADQAVAPGAVDAASVAEMGRGDRLRRAPAFWHARHGVQDAGGLIKSSPAFPGLPMDGEGC